jgi:dienelactone hydrolase
MFSPRSFFLMALAAIAAAADEKPPANQPTADKSEAAGELRVLPETIDGVAPRDLVKQRLMRDIEEAQQRWRRDYALRTTAEQIAAYQKTMRERFIEAIGGFPARTPLNARTTGVLRRDAYRIELVIFESQPRLFVTAALFLPETAPRPYPGVLVPCGHADNAKAWETYQSMGALLALNGMAALVFDPIEQGERFQLLDKEGRPLIGGCPAHTMVAVGSILLGRNTARFEIWDGMRALDYLESRPEVDPRRLGCTGNSGGGTQTSYLMALDDRVRAAAPSCYITSFPTLLRTIGPQDAEQNIFGQLAFGMDHADYLMMRAPVPIMVCAATRDFFGIEGTWESFRYAKRRYTRLGFAERIDMMENDAEHNYDKLQRQSVIRWLARWLLGRDEAIVEPEIALATNEELRSTPRGQVMLLEGARTTYDLNEDYARELAGHRRQAWEARSEAERQAQVRKVAGIRALGDIPPAAVEKIATIEKDGYRIEKLVLTPDSGVCLPALLFVPAEAKPGPVVLFVHEEGKAAAAGAGGEIEKLIKAGRTVLAADLRGAGEIRQTERSWTAEFGPSLGEVFTAYLLGRSFVGMRAEDILVCARHAATISGPAVDLVAVGAAGVPALHAAAVEPQLFATVKLVRTLVSWTNVVESRITRDQLINAVHGALAVYDLPDLAMLLGPKLVIEQPVDARGEAT